MKSVTQNLGYYNAIMRVVYFKISYGHIYYSIAPISNSIRTTRISDHISNQIKANLR